MPKVPSYGRRHRGDVHYELNLLLALPPHQVDVVAQQGDAARLVGDLAAELLGLFAELSLEAQAVGVQLPASAPRRAQLALAGALRLRGARQPVGRHAPQAHQVLEEQRARRRHLRQTRERQRFVSVSPPCRCRRPHLVKQAVLHHVADLVVGPQDGQGAAQVGVGAASARARDAGAEGARQTQPAVAGAGGPHPSRRAGVPSCVTVTLNSSGF